MSIPLPLHPAVSEARRWLGTPYVHQASCRGAGCDCLGLIAGIWRALYGPLPCAIPAYTPDWSETSGQESLLGALRNLAREKPLSAAAAGDVLVFRMRSRAVAKHLGLQSEIGPRPMLIHAYSGRGVVEGPLSAPWTRCLVGRFEFPERI